MNKIKRIISIMLFALVATTAQAQQTAVNADNADFMRSNGKIYVVIAVVITILLGLFFYVFNLDRKISKMEKKS